MKHTSELFNEADLPFNLAIEETSDGRRDLAERLAREQAKRAAEEAQSTFFDIDR